MPMMTEEDRTKNNRTTEIMDSLFEFKPGDLIVERVAFERVKAEFALNAYHKRNKFDRVALGVLEPLSVVERMLKECPGNLQCFYTVHKMIKKDHGAELASLTYIDTSVIGYDKVLEFYAEQRLLADEVEASRKDTGK